MNDIQALDPPPGRRIMQITSSATMGSTTLLALCDDGSVWCVSPFYEPVWCLLVRPCPVPAPGAR